MNTQDMTQVEPVAEIERLKAELSQSKAEVLQLRESLKQAESEAAWYLEIMDACDDCIQMVDYDGRIKFISKSIERHVGIPRDSLIGEPILRLLPPEMWETNFEWGSEIRKLAPGASVRTVHSGRAKDGSIIAIENNYANELQGPLEGIVGITRVLSHEDITTRENWASSESAVSVVFNSVPDFIIVHDDLGSVVNANDKVYETVGLWATISNRHETPSTAEDFYFVRSEKHTLPEIWKSILEGEIKSFEGIGLPLLGENSFEAEIHLRGIKLRNRGLILVTIRDVTERKRIQRELESTLATVSRLKAEAEAASNAKSEFLTNMSHELRTPLNAVIGFSELLEDGSFGELNERQAVFIKQIQESGRHLLNLINDILDLAKIEAGKIYLDETSFNLADLLEAAIIMIKEKSLRHGLKVSIELDNVCRTSLIRADEIKLKQIVFNLLSNAAKFTPDGGSIIIKAAVSDDNLILSVQDTGIGVASEDIQRIFDPFEQVDSSYTRTQQGTGLGLSLTKNLVELHGGKIWVESEGPGKGSIFFFTLPLILAEAIDKPGAEAFKTEILEHSFPLTTGRNKILVVEDNEMNMNLVCGVLEGMGCEILKAWNGEDGERLAFDTQPNLILMDVALPGKNGLEVTKQLKADERTRHIPIIIVTAHAMDKDEHEARRAGCDAFLTKPVDTRALSETIRTILVGA